ncbi:GIY-YIG nuclease family protein [Paenibacillus sp. PsM32]|uniref:GIY-YIG nuclease family protein n=1 Tax=unclassified Paenibacillus TaxID=185978 RepID=UPI00263B4335|nr:MULTISPECIES: GIY-YIG nuclease family protein [unclassified Paenibacillus]MDN4618394.1 GIY-YIG nuclease family protein [Paenibacillus sp. PsM32]MDQ1234420.1 hypothetical protein [Paenibacillus sp. SORGH_AS_0306]MDR6111467.1 hypothetical protein [Paenibacillus sp. SORGH_AS_0338]
MRGRTIKLYTMSEQYKNLQIAELGNWTGKVYIGERKHVQLLKKFEELFAPGIYFLISDIEESYLKRIYIGEADEVNQRLQDHYKSKEWWSTFAIFISKDNNLTKAHVRYLEKELYIVAKNNTTTVKVDNTNIPTGSKMPQSDREDMDEFSENITFVLKNLRIMDFTKTSSTDINNLEHSNLNRLPVSDSPIFKINIAKKQAKLQIVNGIYKLLKGSYIRKEHNRGFISHNYSKLRKQLEDEHYFTVSEDTDFYILLKDIDFKSPSAAGAIVRNSSTNGRKDWKLDNGTSLDDYENNLP